MPIIAETQSNPWMEDINYFQSALYTSHPGAFRYTPKDSFDMYFDQVRNQINDSTSMSELEVFLRKLIKKIRCIHTNLQYPKKKMKKSKEESISIFPFRIFVNDHRAWISVMTSDSVEDYTAYEILSIDQKPISTIIDKLLIHQAADGYNESFSIKLLNHNNYFNLLYYKYFGIDSLTLFTMKDRLGRIVHHKVVAVEPKDLTIRLPKDTMMWDYTLKNHRARIDQERGLGIIEINSFKPYGLRTKSFYRKFFKKLRNDSIGHLVIDLRKNLGGNLLDAKRLLSYILKDDYTYVFSKTKNQLNDYLCFYWRFKHFIVNLAKNIQPVVEKYAIDEIRYFEDTDRVRTKYTYNGQVYVLVDGMSASSSSFAASFLKEMGDAVIIGNETGGGAAGNNGFFYPVVKLPNSGFGIKFPQYWLDYQLIQDEGRGVVPHHVVTYGILDVVHHRDLEMQKVFELIDKG